MRLYNKDKWLDIINDEKYQQFRDLISNTFNELVFDEGPHKYYLHGKELTCVSNITHLFQEHFDESRMAEICEEKGKKDPNYKYAGMSKTEIIESWHENSRNACEHGTERHNFGESCLHFMIGDYDGIVPEFKDRLHTDENGDDYFESLYPKEDAVVTYWQDIPRCIVPILAENKVYDEDLEYSGTFDILFYYDAELDGKDSKKSGFYVMDYKGLDITTPILTTDGWKTMGTVEEGDTVFDKEGNPTKILHTSQIHHRKCYKIKFDNNDEIICDNEHRWLISFWRGKKQYIDKVMTGDELYEYLKNLNNKTSFNMPRIMVSKPINYNFEVKIDPYVLGVWLGGGHSSCEMVTNLYDEIFDEIKLRGYEVGEDVSGGGDGKAKSKTIYGLLSKLKYYNLTNNKHIPYEYLISSFDTKWQVLQGLMDTDGYYNKKRKRFVLTTTKETQVNFSVELLSSLGIKATVIKSKKYCNDKKIDGFDVTFFTEKNPFLRRNIETECPKGNYGNRRIIVSIEECETVPTRCIEVDSDNHTFLCGRNLLVTHNTNKDLYKNFNDKKLLEPFDFLLDMPLSIYKLQLSAYQNCLNKIGLKVIARALIWLKPDGTYEKIKLEEYVNKLVNALKTQKNQYAN